MTVPEATMHKNDSPVSRKYHVGLAGHVRYVKSEAESAPVKAAPEQHFGFRVSVPDPAHDKTALLRIQYVSDFTPSRRYVCFIWLQ